MIFKPVFVGIDRGGTWVRFCGLDVRLRQVFYEKHPSAPIKKFPQLIKRILDANGVPETARCVIASKGAWTHKWKAGYLKAELSGRLAKVEVLSDMEASLRASLRGKNGIAILAGTGSVVFGMNGEKFVKSGGLGPAAGDEGSAYNVAAVWRAISTGTGVSFDPEKVAKTAFSARAVLALARKGDREAAGAVTLGALKLARQAQCAIEELGLKSPLLVTYDGSMMKDALFRKTVFAALKVYTGGFSFKYIAPCESAPWCARRAAGK